MTDDVSTDTVATVDNLIREINHAVSTLLAQREHNTAEINGITALRQDRYWPKDEITRPAYLYHTAFEVDAEDMNAVLLLVSFIKDQVTLSASGCAPTALASVVFQVQETDEERRLSAKLTWAQLTPDAVKALNEATEGAAHVDHHPV